MNTTTLSDAFKHKYGIKEVLRAFRGGQKEVYIVELTEGQMVALKIFHSFGERERKEVELYKKYKDIAGIPVIIDVSDHEGQTVLIEEYIEGQTLKELAESGRYKGDSESISELLRKVVTVLSPIWEDGLIHRDLKPDNIIITPERQPVIIDFGIVKDLSASTITETGFQPNSWKFAAPEQLFAKKGMISYRTDFFSLGVIGYFLYHSRLPFGSTKEEVREQLVRSDCVLVCDEGCAIAPFCEALCYVNPSERPRNVQALLKLLQ